MPTLAPLGPLDLLRSEVAFRRLWYAQLVSEAGDWFQIVALLTLLPTVGGKSHVVAGYLVVRLLPATVLAPFAGLVADRFHRGKTLIACDLLRAAIVLLYVFVVRGDGSTNVPLLYALSFIQEGLAAFFEPARGALIPQVVPTRGLLSANAISGASWSAMLALGAALGGLVTRYLGRNTAYVIDSVTFVASAALVLAARLPGLPPHQPHEPESTRTSQLPRTSAIREGARYLATHVPQAIAASLKGAWGLVGGVIVLFAAFSDQVFTRDDRPAAASALGVLYLGRGVGAFAGPFVARRIAGESVAGLSRALLFAFPIAAVGYVGFALAPSVWPAAIALVVAHCGGSTVWVHSTQLLQLTVPNRLLGRVVAVEWALLTGAMGASVLVTSALLDALAWSPRAVGLALAVLPLLVAVAWGTLRVRVRPALERDATRLADELARRR